MYDQTTYADLPIGTLPEKVQPIFAKSYEFRLIVAEIKFRQNLSLELEGDTFIVNDGDTEIYRTTNFGEYKHYGLHIGVGIFIEQCFYNFLREKAVERFRIKQSLTNVKQNSLSSLSKLRGKYLEWQAARTVEKLKNFEEMTVDAMADMWAIYDDVETFAAAIPQVTALNAYYRDYAKFNFTTDLERGQEYFPMIPMGIFSCFEILRAIQAYNDYQAGDRATLDNMLADYLKIAESRNCVISIPKNQEYAVMATLKKDNSITIKKYYFAYPEYKENLYTMVDDINNSEEKVTGQAQSTDAIAFCNEAVQMLQQYCVDITHCE